MHNAIKGYFLYLNKKKCPVFIPCVGCLFSLLGCRSFGDGDIPEDGQPVSEVKEVGLLHTSHQLAAVCCCPHV